MTIDFLIWGTCFVMGMLVVAILDNRKMSAKEEEIDDINTELHVIKGNNAYNNAQIKKLADQLSASRQLNTAYVKNIEALLDENTKLKNENRVLSITVTQLRYLDAKKDIEPDEPLAEQPETLADILDFPETVNVESAQE